MGIGALTTSSLLNKVQLLNMTSLPRAWDFQNICWHAVQNKPSKQERARTKEKQCKRKEARETQNGNFSLPDTEQTFFSMPCLILYFPDQKEIKNKNSPINKRDWTAELGVKIPAVIPTAPSHDLSQSRIYPKWLSRERGGEREKGWVHRLAGIVVMEITLPHPFSHTCSLAFRAVSLSHTHKSYGASPLWKHLWTSTFFFKCNLSLLPDSCQEKKIF